MNLKDLFTNEFKKTEKDRRDNVRLRNEIEASFEATRRHEATARLRKQELAQQLHALIVPVLREFLRSANQIGKNNLKLSPAPITAPTETAPHFFYEITKPIEISGNRSILSRLFDSDVRSRIVDVYFSAADTPIRISNNSTYKEYKDIDLSTIREQVAKDLVELTKHSLR
jgi:hypothetical protein